MTIVKTPSQQLIDLIDQSINKEFISNLLLFKDNEFEIKLNISEQICLIFRNLSYIPQIKINLYILEQTDDGYIEYNYPYAIIINLSNIDTIEIHKYELDDLSYLNNLLSHWFN